MLVSDAIKYLDGQAFAQRMDSAKTRKRVNVYQYLLSYGPESERLAVSAHFMRNR